MTAKRERAKRYHGTYYYVGTLLGVITCGHKHATARAAQACRAKWEREHQNDDVRTFMATFGMLPGKILD